MNVAQLIRSGAMVGARFLGASSGFVRERPNFCRVSSGYQLLLGYPSADDNVVRNVALNSLTWFPGSTSFPNNVKSVLLQMDLKIVAEGLPGPHELNLAVYHDHAGTTLRQNIAAACYEPTGIAAGTWIGGFHLVAEFPITGANAEITYKLADTAGVVGSSLQGLQVLGYFD